MTYTKTLLALLLGTCFAAGVSAADNDPVKLAVLADLSGGNALVGNNWRRGVDLAVEQLNSEGGILGHKVEVTVLDGQTNPGVARGLVQRILQDSPYVILDGTNSASIRAITPLIEQAGISQFFNGDAALLTTSGYKSAFRTGLGQGTALPRLATYAKDKLHVGKVGILWANNDFGRGGRDVIVKEFQTLGINVVSDQSSEAGQVDFSADVQKLKGAGADAVFLYLNEEDTVRFLRAAKAQALPARIIGETTLGTQSVINLAGDVADGAISHVTFSPEVQTPAAKAFTQRYQRKYGNLPDHNNFKGYIAVQTINAVARRQGKIDPEGFAAGLRDATIGVAEAPGVIFDTHWSATGEIEHQSFVVQIDKGHANVIDTLGDTVHAKP